MECISVIIPIFNVDKYLVRCINSMLRQSYSFLDIILVDDGSTDDSGRLCDEYQKKDIRIRVIHQKNAGLSAARNAGLDIIKGKYVAFVDSDDYVSEDYFEVLMTIMKKSNADLSVCMSQKFIDGQILQEEKFDIDQTICYSNEEALFDVLYRKNLTLYSWGKLIKASLLKEIRFPVGELFEDVRTTYKIYHKAKKIAFNPVCNYYYYQRMGSIVNSEFNEKKMLQIVASEEILNFVKKEYPHIVNAAISRCFIAAADIYRRIPNDKKYAKEKKYAQSLIKKYRKIVLFDRENKLLTRGIALLAVVNVKLVRLFGYVYQILVKYRILRLKKPI